MHRTFRGEAPSSTEENPRDKPFRVSHDLSRRAFLGVGMGVGAVGVSFSLFSPVLAFAQTKTTTTEAGTFTATAPKLPGDLKIEPILDAWIRVDAQGQVTACSGKAELGTGIKTAFIQIAADQLDVDPHSIIMLTADTGATPNEGYTAGSHSVADCGTAIMHAAAQVRALLIDAAAAKLGVSAAILSVKKGVIVSTDGRQISYGQAVADVDLHQAAQAGRPTKDPSLFTVIGQSMPRVDIPGKVTGGASYVQDIRLPGMVHARAIRPPAYGATLIGVDTSAIEVMPGVIKVVRDGSYLAVVADDEWQAIVAMRALSAAAHWKEGPSLPDSKTVHQTLMALPAQEMAVAERHGAAGDARTSLKVQYSKPYLTHGSIGPSCAVALFKTASPATDMSPEVSVWTHTQGVFPLRAGLAGMLSLPTANVRCIHVEGSGCYGHNGADDVAADAALIARAVPNRPIRVQWMREQEHTWEPFGPAMTTEISASLDSLGKIVDWQYQIWTNTHNARIEKAGNLMPTWALATPLSPPPPKEIPMPEGGGDRNSIPLYTIPNLTVQEHFLPDMPIRVSAMRSLGAYQNIFSIESFMDELAFAAHADPVDFRLRHLDDPRGRDVIHRTVDKFGWKPRVAAPAGGSIPRDTGRGFAFAQYKNLMAFFAVALELTVERDTGTVHIDRVVCTVDCGQIVNPNGVKNQIEGGIIQSMSWSLFEQTTFDTRRITSFDWGSYPIMRFAALPRSLEVNLIDRPGQPFLGVGEAAQGPVAAALANAIFDAVGVRIRHLPLAGDTLRKATQV